MNENGGKTRTIEDINIILKHAKIDEDDLKSTVQLLYTKDNIEDTKNYLLLELDKNLHKCIETGSKIVFKGCNDDDVVLCTDDRTYEIKECETSNSLLLTPYLEYSKNIEETPEKQIKEKDIVSMHYTYLEVISCKPRLTKILKLLETTKYCGPENEYKIDKSLLITRDELNEIAQSSEAELKILLKKHNVIEYQSKLRVLDFEYQFRALSYMLKSIDENSWPLDEINKNESVSAWSELIPGVILDSVFDIYAVESKVIDGVQLYKYDEFKVGQFFAKVLLQYAGKFNLQEFLQAWKESMPDGMVVSENMLNGIAIINRDSVPSVIWAFPEDQLPDNIMERFHALFKAKRKWSVTEIKPYIESLTTDKLDANAVLAKYARGSNENGIRYYSSKHDLY